MEKEAQPVQKKWLDLHFYDDVKTCMEVVKSKYTRTLGTYLQGESKSLYELDLNDSVALVFGNEKDGISEEMLNYCDENFIIPQVGMIQSLNISVACAVSLYEAFRQRSAMGKFDQSALSPSEIKALVEDWSER